MGIEIVLAESLGHALDLLAKEGPGLRPVAGASDVLLRLEMGRLKADKLLSVADLKELAYVRGEAGHVEIGALTLIADLERHAEIRAEYPCAVRAAREFASPQIRNRATVGGNIGNASPAADLVPALIALGATVKLLSRGGERSMPLEEFFVGPGQTKLAPGELIAAVRLPRRKDCFQAFAKFGNRAANVIAIANMAMCLALDGEAVREARVAYGSCAPVPLRARAVEAHLCGKRLDEALVGSVREAVLRDIKPIDDVRASRRYRELVAVNATEDALREALAARIKAA